MPTRSRTWTENARESSGNQIQPAPPDKPARKTIELPLLPLVGNVVFPGAIHPLSMVGEQAAELVHASQERGGLVALFLQRELASDPPGTGDLYTVGTLARLEDIQPGSDGEISFNAVGLARVALVDVLSWEPFVLAEVATVTEQVEQEAGAEQLFRQVHDLYTGLLAGSPDAAHQMREALADSTRPGELPYLVAGTIPLSPSARQAILELDSDAERLRQLVPLLAKAHEIRAASSDTPPTGEAPSGGLRTGRDPVTLDRAELQRRLLASGIPPEVRRTAERELEHLAGITPASPDYASVRGYLQCLADLPWGEEPESEIDLDAARSILERDHYGLADVKERIVEYLAVRKLRKQRIDQETGSCAGSARIPGDPVLCLVGPPGIGKTSLGRSVAEALGRPFVRISLGGISDEAEIRGHRRTYMGAMPGKIIQAVTRAGTNQPVIMLDEIDKVGGGGKGDPASALLEVLDPEQQTSFLDHYLDVPYDLSHAFFIATANMLDNVPPALRDRLEVIQLAGYTEDEKVQIALRHIIPRQMEWHALALGEVDWDPEAVLAIVRNYTREAGVRQLERELATICRRIATLAAQGAEASPFKVDLDFASDVLGAPRYLPERAEATGQPGVVTGVVWTPVGGDIIHVEASVMPGSKTLTITGQLGEVMRESAQTALSYVRAEAEALGIDLNFFEQHDVHLHVPSGAVPKDGPSAGITMAAALVALLTGRTVPAETAMTGELTLRGRVLGVGGIKEKILAARRAGIRLLILPGANRRDLDAIAPEMLEGIDFAFASTMEQVLEAAFARPRRRAGARGGRQNKRTVIRGEAEGGEQLPRAAKRR